MTEAFPLKSFNSNQKHERICCTSLTKGISNVRPIGWMVNITLTLKRN
jgi:hypothetical protein